jgi:hypothetical protein
MGDSQADFLTFSTVLAIEFAIELCGTATLEAMPRTDESHRSLSERLRQAYGVRDLEALGALLADDARWGDDDNPRRCRNRSEVLATFARGIDQGIDGEIAELREGSKGIFCAFTARWPEGVQPPGDRRLLYHVYSVNDEQIAEIQQFHDRASAVKVAGVVD